MKTEAVEVIDYKVTDAKISRLRDDCKGLTEINCTEDYRAVSAGIASTRALRVQVEARRKELKADALAYGRRIDGEAKRITRELFDIEAPMKKLKKDFDSEKERIRQEKQAAEKARIEAIHCMIDDIRSYAVIPLTTDSETIKATIDKLEKDFKDKDFQEFKPIAEAEIKAALDALGNALGARLAYEAEAIRQEAERQRLAQEEAKQRAEQEKIDAERAELEAAKRKAAEEKFKIQAEKQAREDAERELKERTEREAKEKAQREQEELKRLALEEALRPDREKLRLFSVALQGVISQFPLMKEPETKKIGQIVMHNLGKIQKYIGENV